MDAKSRILKAGAWIVNQKGFNGTGLAELLEAAKVPKGSFYFYFKNKEDFGLHLIDYFVDYLRGNADAFYQDESLPHIEKIRSVFKWQAESFRKGNFKGGCPIGNLGLEMSTQEPALRERLRQVFDHNVESLESVLDEAVDREDLPALDTHQAACSILALVEGSVMLAKMKNDPEVLGSLKRDVFRLIGAESPVEA